MSENDMTKRVIKAIKNKYMTIFGHPTGRLLLTREAYQINMIEIINALADNGKAIELNSHPLRLDIDWRLLPYAKEKGVLVAIGPDAHDLAGLNDYQYGIGIARKGHLEKKNCLNTLTHEELMKYLSCE
jgi:DNA polymerase (family 10)